MLAERHFKNEDPIKDMIARAHRVGACDSSGRSVKRSDGTLVAKPRTGSSMTKTYVLRNGKVVEKCLTQEQ